MHREPAGESYGILGVGAIGEAIVTGLCEDASDAPAILLSPRNALRAEALAERFPSVAVAPSNQSLVDGVAVVVASVRARDAAT